MKLKLDEWGRLKHIRTNGERRILWFLIESEEGLIMDLIELYDNIERYNSSYDELMSPGDLRSKEAFDHINSRREELRLDIKRILDRLTNLRKRFT